jgi:glutathione reductase (NADPH)
MSTDYDVAVIGTGTSAYHVVHHCLKQGFTLAVIDSRPYGGTCAIRGCQPKKYLIAAAEAVERPSCMQGIGISSTPRMDWPTLIQNKNRFTHAVPGNTESGFKDAGAEVLHGRARFTGRNTLDVDGRVLTAKTIVIATGAIPRPLDIPGENLLTTSDDFLDLPDLPKRILFVGGGFISCEFAHVARQYGSEVSILQKGDRILKPFDPELVDELTRASVEAGINIHTGACVDRIDKKGSGLVATCGETGEQYEADIVIHGAGRVPDLMDLNLAVGSVQYSQRGVEVNAYLQSISNPSVYAIGDAADTPYQLATTADMEGMAAAKNISDGNHDKPDYTVIPSVVFTLPPLASVGIRESDAEQQGMSVKINRGNMSAWPSSRRIGQTHSGYKVIQDKQSGLILGAHILGHNADESINTFALAIKFKLPPDQLKKMIWAYPTYTSDIKYMFK